MSLLARIPAGWRDRLDSNKLWRAVPYVGIVILFLWLAYVQQSQTRDLANQAKREAVKIAEQRSAANAAYGRCVDSIVPTARISTHVAGVNEAFVVILESSLRTLAVTPRSDPLYRVRVANVRKLAAAIRRVAAVKGFPVPTLADCKARRRDALRGIR